LATVHRSSRARPPLRILALIPARSGSRGLRDKNIRRLGRSTLLALAVERALACRWPGEQWSVIVNTDSTRYAALAKRAGAEVPFLRPRALATDTARLIDVVRHTLLALAAAGRVFDLVVMLSPTTPLVGAADVRAALALQARHPRLAVVSVEAEQVPAAWRLATRRGRLVRAERLDRNPSWRRQSAAPSWRLNGAIYIASPAWLNRHGRFVVEAKTVPFVMQRWDSIDIETHADLEVASLLYQHRMRAARGQTRKQ